MKAVNNIIAGALTIFCFASMLQLFSATSTGQQVFLIGTMCISAILSIAILKTNE